MKLAGFTLINKRMKCKSSVQSHIQILTFELISNLSDM